MCHKNEGGFDRIVRVILALVFFWLAWYRLTEAWQIVFYVLSALMIITVLSGYCCLYQLLGISTKKTAKPITTKAMPSEAKTEEVKHEDYHQEVK